MTKPELLRITLRAHLPKLGWLPLTRSAEASGLFPVFYAKRLKGSPIFDEWEYLDPPLNWCSGWRRREMAVDITETWDFLREVLLRISARCSSELQARQVPRGASRMLLRPHELLELMPTRIEPFLVGGLLRREIGLESPTLPASSTRHDWLRSIREFDLLRGHCNPDTVLTDPVRLIRHAYSLLCKTLREEGPEARHFTEAVALLGLGLQGVFPRVRCAVCFRLALPQRLRCRLHTQSMIGRSGSEGKAIHSWIAAQSRLAASVMRTLAWHPNEHVNDSFDNTFGEMNFLAGCLWGVSGARSQEVLLEWASNVLKASPMVRSQLPGHFERLSPSRKFSALRYCLDPQDWVLDAWPVKISAAEQWFSVAASLSPGRARMSAVNQQRLHEAFKLLATGLPKKEVASRLGVSPSHLSHLLARADND